MTHLPWAPLRGHCALLHGGEVWVVGGRDPVSLNVSERVDVWSPSTGAWRAEAPLLPQYGKAAYEQACGVWEKANGTDQTWEGRGELRVLDA